MSNTDFSRAFVNGRELEVESKIVTFKCHTLGELVITTGGLVACDPFVFADAQPFAVKISPGRYPVTLSIASIADDERVAYAKLQVSDKPASRWEMALLPNQELSSLEEGEMFCYSVDSGTDCFMDREAAAILLQKLDSDDDYDQYLMDEMEKNYVHTWDWADINLKAATEANIITFKSGWGDGCYPSYFGYDDNGGVVALVTDFQLFNDEDKEVYPGGEA
jgi:hypothetical protein